MHFHWKEFIYSRNRSSFFGSFANGHYHSWYCHSAEMKISYHWRNANRTDEGISKLSTYIGMEDFVGFYRWRIPFWCLENYYYIVYFICDFMATMKVIFLKWLLISYVIVKDFWVQVLEIEFLKFYIEWFNDLRSNELRLT